MAAREPRCSRARAAEVSFDRVAAQRAQRIRQQQHASAGQAAGLVAARHQQALSRVVEADAALVLGVQQLSGRLPAR